MAAAIPLVGGVVGSQVAGWAFAGSSLASSLGWFAGQWAFNALFSKTPTQKYEGPRLSDRTVQGYGYGRPIPLIFGTDKVATTLIFAADIEEVATTDSQRVGGKGGGGQRVENTSYVYFGTFAVSIGEPVKHVHRIWADGRLIYENGRSLIDDSITAGGQESAAATDGIKLASWCRFYRGGEEQLPDPTMEQHLGIGNVPAHRGLSYLMFERLPLADYGNRVPAVEVEVSSEPGGGALIVEQLVDPIPDGDYAWSRGQGYTAPTGRTTYLATLVLTGDAPTLCIQRATATETVVDWFPLDDVLPLFGRRYAAAEGSAYAGLSWVHDGGAARWLTIQHLNEVGLPAGRGHAFLCVASPADRAAGHYALVALRHDGTHGLVSYDYGAAGSWRHPDAPADIHDRARAAFFAPAKAPLWRAKTSQHYGAADSDTASPTSAYRISNPAGGPVQIITGGSLYPSSGVDGMENGDGDRELLNILTGGAGRPWSFAIAHATGIFAELYDAETGWYFKEYTHEPPRGYAALPGGEWSAGIPASSAHKLGFYDYDTPRIFRKGCVIHLPGELE